MAKHNFSPELLPRGEGFSVEYLDFNSPAKKRRNISLACIECREKKCSGTTPCTTCVTEGRQCLYDLASDRRRKAHTAELLNFRDALYRMTAKLHSGTPEKISFLIQEIQKLPTDQDAVNYLVHGY
ncbi:hypothetical protein N7471_013448 [Penicillium samsonianum]|uniref:uncharacterized protein n=1 Tax=Penicillium samsonianum TaxID=1882272 RepID=UPI0025494946|nr:uncharacterized protein N7471_013448 [Penicillium samsonianum]KAJ6118828.1 hypothetical protein N7471_013448 [Penicillium samsonianum]